VAGRNRLNEEVTHSKLVLVDLAGMWPTQKYLFVILSRVALACVNLVTCHL
jgi:hypothetical protein